MIYYHFYVFLNLTWWIFVIMFLRLKVYILTLLAILPPKNFNFYLIYYFGHIPFCFISVNLSFLRRCKPKLASFLDRVRLFPSSNLKPPSSGIFWKNRDGNKHWRLFLFSPLGGNKPQLKSKDQGIRKGKLFINLIIK